MKNIFLFIILFLLIDIQSIVNSTNNTNHSYKINQNPKNLTSSNNNNKNENEKKNFNLTESLINFYNENFGNDSKSNNSQGINRSKENEHMKIYQEQLERRLREQAERERKAREYEIKRQAEIIRIEKEKIEQRKKLEQAEKEEFQQKMLGTTFNEVVQIYLEKNENEYLYINLSMHSKIVIAFFLYDEEEKIDFLFKGPDYRGNTIILCKADKKQFFYYEYEAIREGEYFFELKNRGSKDNEIVFAISDKMSNNNKDNLKTDNIDKISLLLDNIDKNVNQLRNQKKTEINKLNAHNDRVNKNNKSIIIYSIIEVFTMIIIFVVQSYYITSIVSKL